MQAISITPRAAQPRVTLTSAAAVKVAELIEREGDDSLVLRLGVRPGGCSGFSYEMFFDSQTDDNDIVEEFDGVRLAVDTRSMEMLGAASSERCRRPRTLSVMTSTAVVSMASASDADAQPRGPEAFGGRGQVFGAGRREV